MLTDTRTVNLLKNVQLWLLGIGASLIAIHLNITWRDSTSEVFLINLLFLAFVCFLVKEKRYTLNLESGIFPSILGLLLIATVFLTSTSPQSFAGLFFISPLISGFGLALLASGFKGLTQYKIEFLALLFLSAHKLVSIVFKDISLLTAKFSTAILWYTGFKVTRSGITITLPTGSIKVIADCAGMALILNLLGLAVLFILIFNLKWQQKILIPTVAAILGFMINGVRVALMAVLVAQGDKQAFDYWHFGDGSLIFSIIASLFFGSFCWFLLSINQPKNLNATEL
ncbi:exosortase, cyanobacterial variant [Cylindrospermum stagnale PCC 7417]|uniref:Exosortase, cyanobacterial variant n=1 Tax=Cylindrospermum stagnale PCC 7417 TaxID=56107 RepID=K9WZ58_9NOST|nr:cyanoexosortase A [Cylindrospermum stagnale]AFZ25645.1 exosortase, cyanobacterial variant [Cylindrospermum stagnale PCC 7417]